VAGWSNQRIEFEVSGTATACATLKDAAGRGAGVEVKCQHAAIYDKSILEMQGGFH
jgi:hypothetical protein